MKKNFVLILLLFSFITQPTLIFAQPNNTSVKLTSQLKNISDSINVSVVSIIDNTYNKDSINKDLNFYKSQLNSIISSLDLEGKTSGNNLLVNREHAAILYILSAYRLAINGLLIYTQSEDNIKNINYLFDAIGELREGDRNLTELISALEKAYNTKIQ